MIKTSSDSKERFKFFIYKKFNLRLLNKKKKKRTIKKEEKESLIKSLLL